MTDPKRPRDTNQLAKAIVDLATGDEQPETKTRVRARKAGKAGGPARARARARARALTPEQRSEIARKAASARWKKN